MFDLCICINIAVCRCRCLCRLIIIMFDTLHFSEKFSGFELRIQNTTLSYTELKRKFLNSFTESVVRTDFLQTFSIIYRCASVLSMLNIRWLCTFMHCAYLICNSLSVFQVKMFTPFDLYQTRLTIFRLSPLLCVFVHCCYCCPLTSTME